MSKLDDLITKLCPDGVETYPFSVVFDEIKGMGGVTNKWAETGNCRFIDYLNAYNNLSIDVNDLPFATVKNLEQDTLRKGDILFTSASEVPDECAIASAIEDDIEEGIFLDDHLFGLRPNSTFNPKINTGFLKHYFHSESYRKSVLKAVRGVTRFYISKPNFMKIILPIPPLEVQDEIVRILDKFTSLEAELEAELEARRKQYEYYRDSLLTFGDDVEWKTLADIVSQDCSISYGIVQPGDGVTNGIPVVRPVDMTSKIVHREGLKQTTKEISDSYKRTILKGDELLICVRGTTGIISFAGKDLIGCNVTRGIVPLSFNENIDSSYMFHILKSTEIQNKIEENTNGAGLRQINMKDLRELKIPIPSLKNQKKIGNILDRFESLCNDISIGLPAEIEARHKQYEYYRDKFLTFNHKEG